MDYLIDIQKFKSDQILSISGSKSETNRLLVLQKLYPELQIENVSDSDDSLVMKQCFESDAVVKDVHHAGTAMRFLLSYFALKADNEVILTGSDRMKQRPVKVLVDALRQLGAEISYMEKEGFPPLKIKGRSLQKNFVEIEADVSSQYISALMLIAPSLPNGLNIRLKNAVTSVPYIKMTLHILQSLGIQAFLEEENIRIQPAEELKNKHFTVESDWSSASYYYSIIALAPEGSRISLQNFKKYSLQGDAVLTEIYKDFGVRSSFQNTTLSIEKVANCKQTTVCYQLNNTPDIAQTIIVTCLGLGIECKLSGLHTLKIKETDRLQALKNELEKFGVVVMITDDSIELKSKMHFTKKPIEISTYQDHRMAMAFAPLVLKQPLIIKNAEVVSKSYPAFWNDLELLGINIHKA